MWIIVGIVVVGAVGAVGYYWFRSGKKTEEEYLYFKCLQCRRRLRYRPQQAGKPAMCPQCRNKFVFPAVPTK